MNGIPLVRYGPHEATELQWICLERICAVIAETSRPPSTRELAAHYGRTHSAIRQTIHALIRRGLLTAEPRNSCTWVPTVKVVRVEGGRAVIWGGAR